MVSRELDLFEEKCRSCRSGEHERASSVPVAGELGSPAVPQEPSTSRGEFTETLRGVVTIPLETILWLSSCRRSNFRNFRGDYPDLESL